VKARDADRWIIEDFDNGSLEGLSLP
jgi:hypothetical protein